MHTFIRQQNHPTSHVSVPVCAPHHPIVHTKTIPVQLQPTIKCSPHKTLVCLCLEVRAHRVPEECSETACSYFSHCGAYLSGHSSGLNQSDLFLRQFHHRSPSCNNMSSASSGGHLGHGSDLTRHLKKRKSHKRFFFQLWWVEIKFIFKYLPFKSKTQFFLNQLNKQTVTFQSPSVCQQPTNKTCLMLKLDQCISWPQEAANSSLVWLQVQSRDRKEACGFFIPTRIKQTRIFGFFLALHVPIFMHKNISANNYLWRR